LSETKDYRVLLINPPYERLRGLSAESYPLGLGYLATMLHNRGFYSRIYNAELLNEDINSAYTNLGRMKSQDLFEQALSDDNHPVWQEIRRFIISFQPDVVGITALSTTYSSSLKVARIVKSINPNVKILFGGVHPNICFDQVIPEPDIDYIILGEGEYSVVELIEALYQKKIDLSLIDGLAWKSESNVIVNNKRARIDDLDSLPFVNRELMINWQKLSLHSLSTMIASRGCPYHCTFCSNVSLWGRKVKYRSVANIIEELMLLREKYHIHSFSFWDDTFTSNKALTKELCNALVSDKLNKNLIWECYTRVNVIDEELLHVLKNAGCYAVYVGVESGSQRILNIIKKQITKEQVRSAAKLIKDIGLYFGTFFMVGNPYETEDDIKQTISFIEELDPDYVNLCTFMPYPGTELFDQTVDLGLFDKDINWKDLTKYSQHSEHNYFAVNISKDRYNVLVSQLASTINDVTSKPSKGKRNKFIKRMIYLVPYSFMNPVVALRKIRTKFLNKIYSLKES
jgi:radical SAM superfamily enzyme YgiQ (UPF0313 family)